MGYRRSSAKQEAYLSKEICKKCRGREGKPWERDDDWLWDDAGVVACKKKKPSRVMVRSCMSPAPIDCPFALEHLVSPKKDKKIPKGFRESYATGKDKKR